jgi:hypothetical protein
MRSHSVTNFLLLIIAIALIAIAARPLFMPIPAHAQLTSPYPIYIEPGTQSLRAPDGSVDLRTGKIWGFPTNTPDTYPVNGVEPKPQTSHPFVLGRFALEEKDK